MPAPAGVDGRPALSRTGGRRCGLERTRRMGVLGLAAGPPTPSPPALPKVYSWLAAACTAPSYPSNPSPTNLNTLTYIACRGVARILPAVAGVSFFVNRADSAFSSCIGPGQQGRVIAIPPVTLPDCTPRPSASPAQAKGSGEEGTFTKDAR